MIGYFPDFYPDELLYSVLARYHAGSGYLGYITTAEDLFSSPWSIPDIEFLNTFTEQAVEIITRNHSMEEIVMNHTMFPHYARFLDKERRNRAFDSLLHMQGKYYKMLAVPKKKANESKNLKYCPLCTEEDYDLFGETYWHRIHQMPGVNVCPKHGCYLYNSPIENTTRKTPALEVATDYATKTKVIVSENESERKAAKYIGDVLKKDVDLKSGSDIGEFLHSRIIGTKYASNRGVQRNITLLFNDFRMMTGTVFWNSIDEVWKLSKIFTGDRRISTEICLVAFFIGITPEELVKMEIPEKRPEVIFDEKVYELRDQGFSYPEIARRLNSSINVVKPIGENLYGHYNIGRRINKGGMKCGDGNKRDVEALPMVKIAVKETYNTPKRVTPTGIQKKVGLPSKSIANMPLCMAEIKKYQETQEVFWARKTVCMAKKIIESGLPLNWTRLQKLTNIRKKDRVKYIRYLSDFADEELARKIETVMLS